MNYDTIQMEVVRNKVSSKDILYSSLAYIEIKKIRGTLTERKVIFFSKSHEQSRTIVKV